MSKIHLVTPSLCRQWGACYDDDKLHNLLGDGLTPLKVLALDIPVADRLWTVLRPELLTDCDLRLFGCWCATLALKAEQSAGHEPDDRSWAAVNVAEQFAYGRITKSEMAAAEADAWSAARAADKAARAAAWAAWAAAEAASAASAAARVTGRAAEAVHIDYLRDLLSNPSETSKQ